MTDKSNSPFTPGSPVPVELFVGRASQTIEIMRSVRQAVSGRQENIFLVGERGVGKTSIAAFARYWAQNEHDVLGVQVFLGGVDSLEEMVRRIFEALLKAIKGEKWFDKVRALFGDFIREVGLFGVSVGFAPGEEDLGQLVRDFPQSLHNLVAKVLEERKGVFIILDDLDTLSTLAEFANWYKSFVDEVATSFDTYPVAIMLIGLPGMIDGLLSLQPSLMRIFKVIELEKLDNDEVRGFFKKAFENAQMKVEDDALDVVVNFSGGIPAIMHEIGDATFWGDEDGVIDHKDALRGVVVAAERIGKKYLDPQVYRAIRSNSYRSILRKLGLRKIALSRSFTRKAVAIHLSDKEKRALDNFLRRLRQIGIIEPDTEMGRGCYRFVNDIYPVYIWLEAQSFVSQRW